MNLIMIVCLSLGTGRLAFRTSMPTYIGGRSASALRAQTSTSSLTVTDSKLAQDMLYRVRQVNSIPKDVKILPFVVDDVPLGKILPANAKLLCDVQVDGKAVFETALDAEGKRILTLAREAGDSVSSRTRAVGHVMEVLRDAGVVRGWRDETYPVTESFYKDPLFHCERAAISLLGALEYGVHINGVVEDEAGRRRMWIGRRSRTKSKYPGMLDHIAAGGQPSGLGLTENVIKECGEEAGIPEHLARRGLKAAGAISYESMDDTNDRITRCVLFNYDLVLPEDFVPKPVDGEVEEFFLWSMDQVKAAMDRDYPDPIKPNCYVVIIDYLLRMGEISPESAGYLDLLRELRSGDCR